MFVKKRDGRKHASPNAGLSEAAVAGALGVELAGDAHYFGKLVHKEIIGDAKRKIEAKDILRANRMMFLTEILTLTGAVLWHISMGAISTVRRSDTISR